MKSCGNLVHPMIQWIAEPPLAAKTYSIVHSQLSAAIPLNWALYFDSAIATPQFFSFSDIELHSVLGIVALMHDPVYRGTDGQLRSLC